VFIRKKTYSKQTMIFI